MAEPEVEETYVVFWKDIIEVDGQVDLDSVKAELHDYMTLQGNVARAYVHFTRGRISKPFTSVDSVIQVADDVAAEDGLRLVHDTTGSGHVWSVWQGNTAIWIHASIEGPEPGALELFNALAEHYPTAEIDD